MIIIVKNKDTLLIDDFKFKCSIGKKGVCNKKFEGDLTTPKGIFNLGNIYYRSDRVQKPFSKLKYIIPIHVNNIIKFVEMLVHILTSAIS